MKRTFLSGLFCLSLIGMAWATLDSYVNDGVISIPPTIDATNFINNNQFYATNSFLSSQYYTYNTLNVTNRGLMEASIGFRFDLSPSSVGTNRSANNFINSNPVNPANAKLYGGQKVEIWATNIVNRGLLNAGQNGLLKLTGQNIDLTRSTLKVDGFDTNSNFFFGGFGGFGIFFLSEPGVFDDYWGTSTNSFGGGYFRSPSNLQPNRSPFHGVTNVVDGFYNINFFKQLVLTNFPSAGANQVISNRMSQPRLVNDGTFTNFTITVVYMSNSNNVAMPVEIRFEPGFDFYDPIIQWAGVTTNRVTGIKMTNWLYLTDNFGSAGTNLQVISHLPISTVSPKPTFAPINYNIFRSSLIDPFFNDPLFTDPGLLFDATDIIPMGGGSEASYGALLAPVTQLKYTNIPNVSVSNMLGRIEINAGQQLDLSRARIDGLNYLLLKATNHYVGSSGAHITAPFSDVDLASTNGSIVITNFLQPLPRCSGNIFLWSGRFTNTFSFPSPINGLPAQYRYHFLMVDARLEPESPAMINNLSLRSRNSPTGTNRVIISDQMNIMKSLLIEAEQVTVAGELNFLSPNIAWSNGLPSLKWFTNDGRVVTLNASYFGGAEKPYSNFVNHGFISTVASRIWADIFVNTGTIIAESGPMSVQSLSAALTGSASASAVFSATNGDITINSGSLLASNLVMEAGRKLTFAVTNWLTDGGTNASNFWTCHDGFDLLVKPTNDLLRSDLLGTTVTNKAFDLANVINTWTATNRGRVREGYSNNVAIGHLVLDRGFDSLFTFQGTAPGQAIYVDYLELKNFPTSGDLSSPFNFTNEVANPITLYFARATVNGLPAEDRLNNTQGGHIKWVQNYAGAFSSASVTLRNGSSIQVNKALLQSSSVDSDADGLANSIDTFPFDGPSMVPTLSSSATNKVVTISWNAAPTTAYTVDWTTNLVNWQVLTNLTSGPSPGTVSIQDAAPTGTPRFYRVRYSP